MKSKIKENVMRRVQMIRTFRPLVSDLSAAIVLFLLALYGIGNEVWVAQVVANMPPLLDIAAVTRFVVAAFANTELIVQVCAVLALLAAVWTARGVARSLAELIQQKALPVSA